jgi:hypothetical protein
MTCTWWPTCAAPLGALALADRGADEAIADIVLVLGVPGG